LGALPLSFLTAGKRRDLKIKLYMGSTVNFIGAKATKAVALEIEY
jgi:hypothetical protein